jgi:hypothetical protein
MIFNNIWFEEETTQELRHNLANYTQEWDDSKGMFRDKPLHNWASHYADSARYMACVYKELTEPVDMGSWTTDYSKFI